jgi:hypothetical protein
MSRSRRTTVLLMVMLGAVIMLLASWISSSTPTTARVNPVNFTLTGTPPNATHTRTPSPVISATCTRRPSQTPAPPSATPLPCSFQTSVALNADFNTGSLSPLVSTVVLTDTGGWATVYEGQSCDPDFAAVAPDPPSVSDQRLSTSYTVPIPSFSVSAYLNFYHSYAFQPLDEGYRDGGVLELSTDSGQTWFDADSRFDYGGYNGAISRTGETCNGITPPFTNGQNAWVGTGSSLVSVNMSEFIGQSIMFRFRLGTDCSGGGQEWRIDDVRVYYQYLYACQTTATASPTRTAAWTNTPTPSHTGTPTSTPDCSSVDVHPTNILPPGAFIYVTVPPDWTWSWDPITALMQYNCYPNYPTGVNCYWSCSIIEPRIGYAAIHIYDQIGVERCLAWIEGHQPYCPPTAISTRTPTSTAPRTPTATPTVTGTPPTAAPTATACALTLADVPSTNTFYPFVRCLACKLIVSGYPCGGEFEPCDPDNRPYFRPYNPVTRGQVAKIASESAQFYDPVPPSQQTFADVPYDSPFWLWVERLSSRGVMSGYPCGGIGEPCDSQNRPYFRPNAGAGATRGQLAKIVSEAAGFATAIPPTQQSFADVAPGHTFWLYIERLLLNRPGVMAGYPCGGSNEPCDSQNRPYFRPNNGVTRGQTSKIVANTFFPGCSPPLR